MANFLRLQESKVGGVVALILGAVLVTAGFFTMPVATPTAAAASGLPEGTVVQARFPIAEGHSCVASDIAQHDGGVVTIE